MYIPKIKYTVNKEVVVQNQNGTASRSCGCKSWIKHWEEFSKEVAILCSVKDCYDVAEHGAHVTRPKNESLRKYSYIIPMCSTHNRLHGKELTVKSMVTFVWANVGETCGK